MANSPSVPFYAPSFAVGMGYARSRAHLDGSRSMLGTLNQLAIRYLPFCGQSLLELQPLDGSSCMARSFIMVACTL